MVKYKNLLLLILISLVGMISSCKHTKEIEKTNPISNTQQIKQNPEFEGYVTHSFRKNGCATLVILKHDQDSIILIPVPKLPAAFDIDQLNIKFNYLPLRIQNPLNCNMGIPAEISDIE